VLPLANELKASTTGHSLQWGVLFEPCVPVAQVAACPLPARIGWEGPLSVIISLATPVSLRLAEMS
jgi:hypothetical protein